MADASHRRRVDWSLRSLSETERPEAIPLLTRAFRTSDEIIWVAGPGDGSEARVAAYSEWMMRYTLAMADSLGGDIAGAFDKASPGSGPTAVSISFPPGVQPYDNVAVSRSVLKQIGRPPMWSPGNGWDGHAKARHFALSTVARDIHSRAVQDQPHWYLNILGTAPAAQGTGAGAALVGRLSALAASDRTPLYLETGGSSNPAWYQRRGFRINEKCVVDAGVGEPFAAYGGFHAMLIDAPGSPSSKL